MFYEKELQKPNQTNFRIEKVKKKTERLINCKWKVVVIHLVVGLIKKILFIKRVIFPNLVVITKIK